mgnify:CR=1 FL=1
MRRNAMIIALAMSLLCACGPAKEENVMYNGKFILVGKDENFNTDIDQYILYDPETMVMYIFIKGYKSGGLSVIYNADGTPKVYSPEE